MSNVVVTGFMGTGKSVVGRQVARRMGRPFVDMDAEIEARAGKSIPRIFAQDGEATFRQMEATLCDELSAQGDLVVATGGGALVDPANRSVMMKSGAIVCLTCDADEILRRVREGATYCTPTDRPLLNVADPRAEIERLLKMRRKAYADIPWQIDTTRLSIEEVAEQVIELADVITLPVRYPGGEYPIHIGDGLLAHVGGALRAAGVPEDSRVAIVSNPVVAPLYGTRVEDALRAAGFRPFACSMPDGEPHKTLATVATLYEQFLVGGLDRSGTVLSLGGGVTGDVAGFAAASFMRGVRFAQAPTTLLAMVDASVGGKTGADLPQGKNLVGAFKQPVMVLIDPAVLATLPGEEIRSGMAELIKHSVIDAPELFVELERGPEDKEARGQEKLASLTATVSGAPPRGRGLERLYFPILQGNLGAWIVRSLHVKIAVVEQDPYEQSRRAVLNLGHTVGHALERLSGFSLRHGETVSIGMVAAARIAVKLGRANPSLAERIEELLAAWWLPVRCPPFDADAIWEAMAHDKKRRGRSLRWVIPRAIGRVEIVKDIPLETVTSVLRDLGAR